MSLPFQRIIQILKDFWAEQGCIILEPYNQYMGAATFHPATVFSVTKKEPWKVAYLQPCSRPADSRFAMHANRWQHYYQFQVILKPATDNVQKLYLRSLNKIGISRQSHDLNFIEDDWKSPTLGAFGLGWEVTCGGMEISQLTYMTQIAGIKCDPIIFEITYGLERIALILQQALRFSNIEWSDNPKVFYGDIFNNCETEFSHFNVLLANIDKLKNDFLRAEEEIKRLVEANLPLAAYDHYLQAVHCFNILDARGVVSAVERQTYLSKTKNLAALCMHQVLENYSSL